MFSVGASKLKDSALKFGEIASQKVVQVSETVGEKVRNVFFLFLSTRMLLFFTLYENACCVIVDERRTSP